MALSLFLALLCVTSLVMLVKQISSQDNKHSIAGTTLADQRLGFTLTDSGRYTVWTKRKTNWSLLKRGVHNHVYRLVDKTTGQSIPLTKQKDDSEISNNKRGRHPWIENRWKTHYSFEAPAGQYELSFRKSADVSKALGAFGFFNPFKEMDPAEYTVEVTPYYSKGNALKSGLLMACYFIVMFVSLILLLTPSK